MADEELEQEPVNDKYNLGAADLEKVNAFEEEQDDASGMGSKLGKLAVDAPPQQKTIVVSNDDVKMIMDQLELPKVRVEAALIEHDGNVSSAIRSIMRL